MTLPFRIQNTSSIIKTLYKEDIEDRYSKNWDTATKKDLSWLKKRDKKRRDVVAFFHQLDQITKAEDCHHASLIFQHGETSSDYLSAHEFAEKAVELGDKSAKWLVAATEDRYLLSIGKAQKYGTQFQRNGDGEWKLAEPIDPNITDGERAKYNVPPLSEAVEKYKEKYGMR